MKRPSAGEITAAFIAILTGLAVLATAFDLDLGFTLTQKTPATPTIEFVATPSNIPIAATKTATPTIKPPPSATFTPLPATPSPSATPTHLLTTISPTIEVGISPTIAPTQTKTTVPLATKTPAFCINTARVSAGVGTLFVRNPATNWSVVGSLSEGRVIQYITESAIPFNNLEYVRLINESKYANLNVYIAQKFLTVLRTDC